MNSDLMRKTAMFALNNKEDLKNSKKFGCYSCLKSGPTEEIESWTDNSETAICPYCQVDTVLADLVIPISEENLKLINEFWFTENESFAHSPGRKV